MSSNTQKALSRYRWMLRQKKILDVLDELLACPIGLKNLEHAIDFELQCEREHK